MASETRQLEALILAAGQGVRMGGGRAKVLYPVAGRAMIQWVLDACEQVGCRRIVVVVGHQGDLVRSELAGRRNVEFVEQKEQRGTGHAVLQARPLFLNPEPRTPNPELLVLCGDGPLVRPETLRKLLETHRREGAAATLATSVIDDATGYGRIIRDADGRFVKIVEDRDADASQKKIREINPSYYCFGARELFGALARVTHQNAKGEYYLTDVFPILLSDGKKVAVVEAVPPQDVLSINTPDELSKVDGIMRNRFATCGLRPASQGVSDPQAASRRPQAVGRLS